MPFAELFSKLKINPKDRGYGEYARLFPALSEKGKEGRAASIFLAVLSYIPEFANELLSPIGRPIGKRSTIVALTEVLFPGETGDRPDGLIAVKTGNSFWTCLVEFKVGGTLEADQVERYLKLARSSGIDSVLTISNDIVPTPDVSPVKVNGQLTRTVSLFHVSWMQILSHLQLLVANDRISDTDHRMIVREFIRFLTHPSTGIKGFTAMPEEWGELIDAARDRKPLHKSGSAEQAVVNGWMQEERELAFILSERTTSFTQVVRSRAEKASTQEIVDRHLKDLVTKCLLQTQLSIENAAAPILIELDLQSRSIRISMTLQPPKDRAQSKAVITWLTRQLPKEELSGIHVEVEWPGRGPRSDAAFEAVREDPYAVIHDRTAGLPSQLRLVARYELQKSFSSRKGIITALEDGVLNFYKDVGQHLKGWVAPPPRAREKTTAESIVDDGKVGGDVSEEG